MKLKAIGLIPVRLKSSRIKEKPLLQIAGLPMFAHTYFRSKLSKKLDDLILCCDDEKILKIANKLKIKSTLTKKNHKNGTERIYEVYQKLGKKFDLIIDIQGDEPLVNPHHIDKLIEFHSRNLKYDIILPSTKIKKKNKDSLVKVVKNIKDEVLYFSRLDIPFSNNNKQVYFKHSSIISFLPQALMQFAKSKIMPLEKTENIELLRALEIGLKIKSPTFIESGFSVDVKSDFYRVIQLIKKDKLKKKNIRN